MHEMINTVELDSFTISYLRFGRGDDTLVILPGASIQSVMGAADAIVDAYAPLAESFNVYLLDYRRDLPDPYPMRDIARDAYEALRALGLDQAHLFGASLGGMVALVLATEHPEFVKKLVLGSTAARVSAEQRRLFEKWALLAEAGDTVELYRAFGEAVYPPEVFEQLWEQLDKVATEDDLARFAIFMRSIEGFDITGELDEITCPVLAIGSSDDRIFGAGGTLQIADILGGRAGFEMHLYDDYGHAAYDIAPDYKDRMLRFLTS